MRRESHRLVSILLTLLLVTGTIAPVTALGPSEAGNTGGFGPDPVGEVPPPRATLDTDQPAPRDRLHTAEYLLSDIDADGGQQRSAIRQVERRVNSSLDDYRDAYRVDSQQKFTEDAQATTRLTAFAGTSHATAANVTSAQLLWADRDTATLAIEEAERGIDRAEDRASEQDLRKAERAIEQAESALGRADGHADSALDDAVPLDQRLRTRAKAIRAYGQAWKHARRALQILDRAVAPEITVRQQVRRPTPNASEYTRIVTGEIADPQAYELDSVRVQVGDRNPFEVPLNASTAPTTNATYSFPVTLSGPTEITVTARDPVETDRGTDRDRGSAGSSTSQTVGDSQSGSADAGKQASNGNDKAGTGKQNRGKNGDKDQKNKGDDKRDKDKNKDKDKNDDPPGQSGDQTDTAVVKLDGDGLPEDYEVEVTKTDPLDADSDSARTDANEADDGTIDGYEDFDGDNVSTFVEYREGLDPFDADTDDDQLTDRFELDWSPFDPLDPDSDGDGVRDGADDYDGENLTNVREQQFGTDPTRIDTDRDRLTDKYEVDTTQTDPLRADSDSARTDANESRDGTIDGNEDFDNDTLRTKLEFNLTTDPFDEDTDGDRLLDPFEYEYDTLSPVDADTDGDGLRDDREDPDNETLRNIDEQRYGTDPLNPDTDADNLTDAYEVNVSTTVPTDPDSDASRTNVSEANDGITDGKEDFDTEGLTTALEARIGTDPFDADTDDDRLTDAFEHRYRTMEPLRADTDDDGVPDGQEDPDNETLVNVREQRYGTSPLDPDTDGDTLTDAEEVDTAETVPVDPDSDSNRTARDESDNGTIDGSEDFDGDGLNASTEFELGTSPFDPDTDGDGLRDGFEVLQSETDPLDVDSDGDNTTDAFEDHDADDLVNEREQAFGSDPRDADTDGDNLEDGFEADESLTLPTDPNSNSTGTPENESLNGTTDDAEDLDGDGLSNLREQKQGTDPLTADTDGDNLPDGFEVDESETDPLDVDSDSAGTAKNEADDGITDDRTELDGDGLITGFEWNYGADPLTADTDGDSLSDGFEVRYAGLSATNTDTDGDGVTDPKDDADGDGLTNAREQALGTSSGATDTDFDGLSDPVELKFGTDPLDPDTDGDGLTDGEERGLPTSPTDPDSDDDGVLDGNETFTTRVEDPKTETTVEIDSAESAEESVSVEASDARVGNSSVVAGASVSERVAVRSNASVETATVTVGYDDSAVEESDVGLYRYDREAQTYVEMDAAVDTGSDTLSASMSPAQLNGTFVAFDRTEWEAAFADPLPVNYSVTGNFTDRGEWTCDGDDDATCSPSSGKVEVGTGESTTFSTITKTGDGSLTREVDGTSDSTNTDDGGSLTKQTTTAEQTSAPTAPTTTSAPTAPTKTTTTSSEDGDVGVECIANPDPNKPCFTTERPTATPTDTPTPTPTKTEEKTDYDPPDDDPTATDTAEPVPEDTSTRSVYGRSITLPDAEKITMEASVQGTASDQENASASFILVDEFGKAETFFVTTDGSDKKTIEGRSLSEYAGETVSFRLIAVNESKVTLNSMRLTYDTDGDGLSDNVERNGIRTGDGEVVYTDPYDADTDGDGLRDGYEVTKRTGEDGKTYFQINSNPTTADTDGDGITDFDEEYEVRTVYRTTSPEETRNFINADSDGERTDALDRTTATTDALDADTDGDGLSDSTELELSTDPSSRDTDGDGITDSAERNAGEDPTIHDYRPPTISVTYANFNQSPDGSDYRLVYKVSDPSGVSEVSLIKSGEPRETIRYDGQTTVSEEVTFSTGLFEDVLDSFTSSVVKVEAVDVHRNSQRVIGLERANFYGSLAEEFAEVLPDNTYFNTTVAGYFGLASGALASLGATIKSGVDFIQGLPELLDTLQNLTTVLQNLDIPPLEQIANGFIKQFQQKQEAANPFTSSNSSRLYETFRGSWYSGYVLGFIAKTVIGASAVKFLKGTTKFQKLASKFSNSKVGALVSKIKSPVDAAKARAVSGLLRTVDDVPGEYIGVAPTAGSAFRLWRVGRKVDGDIGTLSKSQQSNLGRTILRSDSDTREAIQRMDDATLDEYTELDVDPRIRAGIALQYVDLDADDRVAVREFIDQTARFDAETRVGLRAAYSRGDIDVQTGKANTIAEEIQDYGSFKRVTKIDQTGRGTNVEGEVIGKDGTDISVKGRFYGDGDRYVRALFQENADTVESVFTRNGAGDLYDSYGTDAIKHLDEVSDGTAVNIRGQLGEEVLQPELERSKYGRGSFRYDPESKEGSIDNGYIGEDDIPYNLDGSEQGFDGFAVDDDGNLVIIETKVKNANGRVTNAKWLGERLSSGNRQMSDEWIENKFESLVQSAESPKQKEFIRQLADDDGVNAIDISERGGRLQLTDVNTGKIKKELIAYQDAKQTGELASSSLRQTNPREPSLDSVEIIKIRDVFKGI